MAKKIIAFFGEAGSGKDTLTNELVRDHNYRRLAFGDALKTILSETYAIPIRYFNDRTLKDAHFDVPVFHTPLLHSHLEQFFNQYSTNKFVDYKEFKFSSPREMMQLVGTEIFRESDSAIWCKILESKLHDGGKVVISDGRFIDERIWLRKNGAKLIRILRPTKQLMTHKSENDLGKLDEYDIIINNDSSYVEFIGNFNLWYIFIGSRN